MSVERDGWKPQQAIPGGYTLRLRGNVNTDWIGHVIPCAGGTRYAAISTNDVRKEYATLDEAIRDMEERKSAWVRIRYIG